MSKRMMVWMMIGLLAMTIAAATGCTNTASVPPAEEVPAQQEAPAEEAPESAAPEMPNVDTTGDSLEIEDTVEGTGAEAKSGSTVTVNYTGWLTDGTKFDSSLDAGQPFTFPLGAGQVIKGWDEGVEGMKVGGTRILVIPADLAYGDQGAGGVIPPDATLVFQVELLDVQ